jgi:hypothetical protein
MATDEKLIKATYLLGLIPLAVGLTIFISWWVGKAWFVTTLHGLEGFGLAWILISIPLGVAGLVTGLIYLFRNFKTNFKNGLFALSCVLINIPTVEWVVNMQDKIDQRAYVRIYNNTSFDFASATIQNSRYTENYNSINASDYKTGYFYPNYDWLDSTPVFEKVILKIETKGKTKEYNLPDTYRGECLKVYINAGLKIEIK